jgi:hypothetical protein
MLSLELHPAGRGSKRLYRTDGWIGGLARNRACTVRTADLIRLTAIISGAALAELGSERTLEIFGASSR